MPVGDTAAAVTGTLDFLDNAVDSMTGTIMLKAEFANKDSRLWPGGLVRVQLALSVDKNALVVPSGAVVTGQQGSYVYVVHSDTAHMRPVTLQRQSDSIAVLTAGVKPGEQVVIDGQLRLTDGARVQVQKQASGAEGRCDMNISEPFIQRPVMTTLVMAGILVFGVVAYRSLPVSDLPAGRLPHHLGQRDPAGREPRDDGVVGGDAAGEAVLDHRRPRGDDLHQLPGQHLRSRCSSRSTATSTRPRRTCRRRSPRRIAPAAAGHPAADLPEGGPVARRRSSYYALHLGDAAAVAARRVRRDQIGAAALDGRGRGAGAGVRLAEVRRADPARSPGAGGAADRHRRGERRDRATATSTCRPASSGAPTRPTRCRPTGSCRTPRSSGRWSWPSATARPVRLRGPRPGARQRAGHQGGRAGTTATRGIVLAIQRQPGTNTVEVADARAEDDGASCRPQLPAVGRGRPRSTTARRRSASR